ncbi:hypothetical protein TNCV_1320571 [Trichonephila clavipes]|nr:hypothetical protein TNCV_1320571 [Trichonephila clavipes]
MTKQHELLVTDLALLSLSQMTKMTPELELQTTTTPEDFELDRFHCINPLYTAGVRRNQDLSPRPLLVMAQNFEVLREKFAVKHDFL